MHYTVKVTYIILNGADRIMEVYVKRFEEISVEELYEILKVKIAVFSLEKHCLYQDLEIKSWQKG